MWWIGRLGLAVALFASACTTAGSEPITLPIRRTVATASPALITFDHCDQLLGWIKEQALQRVGPWGLDGWGNVAWDVGFEEALPAEAGPLAATTRATIQADADGLFSNTNVQELGIDEPDLVKTDGDRILVVSGDRLYYVAVEADGLRLEGSVSLGIWTQDLFLLNDRAVAISSSQGWMEPMPAPALDGVAAEAFFPQLPVVTVIEIDLSDPAELEVTRTLRIDGRYVSARLVHDRVRLVISAPPVTFEWAHPSGGGLRAERRAVQENRRIIEESTIEDWLPYYILERGDSVTKEGVLTACAKMHRPEEFSGFSTLSVVTLDEDRLDIADATGLFADGEIVYSSGEAMYVATNRWMDPVVMDELDSPGTHVTRIHKFALTARSADYRASGEVPGFMLSQWSMSEHEDHLRVASTSTPRWWGGDSSESFVTVLEEENGALREVGQVGGLGKGEQIYSVRFIGDVGYVVTFRQIDPLYVIDLSDPTSPRAKGELKIPGYSAYLHPLEDGILLGVGQDATDEGRVLGTQVSVFDVSNPADPHRLHKLTLRDASSEVEWDHHAFLHWPQSGLTVLPLQRWAWDNGSDEFFAGALVLETAQSGIREIGNVSHGSGGKGDWAPAIRRALMVNGMLVTVSDRGLKASDPQTLQTLDWIELA